MSGSVDNPGLSHYFTGRLAIFCDVSLLVVRAFGQDVARDNPTSSVPTLLEDFQRKHEELSEALLQKQSGKEQHKAHTSMS